MCFKTKYWIPLDKTDKKKKKERKSRKLKTYIMEKKDKTALLALECGLYNAWRLSLPKTSIRDLF